MEILLHLGAHRCASTTFQSYLWSNRKVFAKTGLTSWTPKRTRDGLLRGMMRHPALITVDDERMAIRSVGRIRIELDRLERAGQQGLLISEENILGSMANNLHDFRLYPLVRERLMRFLPVIEDRKLTIGLCIRSYEDYWTSCLTHLLARGHARPSTDTLDLLTTQNRRWRSLVRNIATVFPDADIVVWPFESLAGDPGAILQTLWGRTSPRPVVKVPWNNRGANVVKLNEILAMRGERLINDQLVDAGSRWMPFDEDQRSVLRAEYRRDLAWLQSGAEGLARYVTAQSILQDNFGDARPTRARNDNAGRSTPAHHPDRETQTRTPALGVVPFGGRSDGIKEGLGRTGAT